MRRNGQLIEWEEDIDMGTLATRDDFRNAEFDLNMHGWKVFDKYKGISIQNEECKTKVDIKFYKEEEDYVYAYFVVYKHRILLPICDLLLWWLRLYPSTYKYETILPRRALDVGFYLSYILPMKTRKLFINLIEKVYYDWSLTGHKIKFPREWVLPLCVLTIRSFSFGFRIPACPDKILELAYGKNWKKPNRIIPGTDRYEDGSSRYLTVRVMESRPDLVEVAK